MIRYVREGGALVAYADVRVGVAAIELAVRLGPWDGPDPPAEGLGGRPIVIVTDEALVHLAVAGALRSGKLRPDVIAAVAPSLAARLLGSDADAVVTVAVDGDVLGAIRALGGRPIPALPWDDPRRAARLLEGSPVDVDVPIPSVEPGRTAARDMILDGRLAEGHHPLEVDPRPAFAEIGADPERATLGELSAAAAGVLAGRVAARNRRWRATP